MLHSCTMRSRKTLRRGLMACTLAATLALCAALTPIARAAATIFVRADGSDTLCNGTADAPAPSTPNCAFATIQKGVATVDAGGTVNVRGHLQRACTGQ